ncbi:hypothetical protein MtrunA17_Chr8g0391301 [Medicago truncatula]|uniref:Transmembrane protein n=1 Tax=Medicago truncatula TaxID=3880 RepID=A0A396GW84_MEDTR|nr:hypothetical protein MtrunA17_Chr8g0391301 [Medicago truncatula]
MYYNSSVFIWICSSLCCYGVLLVAHWFSDKDVAVLKDSNGVTEDEIDCSIDVAVTVELTVGVNI